MKLRPTLVSLLATVLVVGCGTSAEQAPRAQPAPASAQPALSDNLPPDEAAAFCLVLHEQLAACAGEFIDMNLDLRAKYFPPFAQQVADPVARAEMRKEGVAEAIADGTGPIEARRDRCQQYVAHGPKVPRSDVAESTGCFQKASCAEKIACMRPTQEARYAARAREPGESTPEGAPKMK
jgi:hypothetical protein